MVKRNDRGKRSRKQGKKQEKKNRRSRVTKITSDTTYGECTERLTAFGGLLALLKFLDLIKFKEVFEKHYTQPRREPKLGNYRMILGILMLLFIGFQRLGHFTYLKNDPMLLGILRVKSLPVVSTFWRYLRSLTMNQSTCLVRMGAVLRPKVWELCEYAPKRVTINIDTTVQTVYGNIEGAKKGHNPKHRGKKGLRPILCFVAETREYLCGNERSGETVKNTEVARYIRQFRELLPECVEKIEVCGDGEIMGWAPVEACLDEGFMFIFANKRCEPDFPDNGWYKHKELEYNECLYQPTGWERECRFVVVRIPKDQKESRQLKLFKGENYVYRVFVTNKNKAPHLVIRDYDKRADVENSIGEAQREGLLAIPSRSFQAHHAFFQIVMMAYNLWRWMKMLAGHAEKEESAGREVPPSWKITMPDHTIRIARLKMLFVAAKIVSHSNNTRILYSMHEQRAAGLTGFLDYLDRRRAKAA